MGSMDDLWMIYPLVNCYITNITMENHHAINGKSTMSMAIFNSYVKLPDGMDDLWMIYGC